MAVHWPASASLCSVSLMMSLDGLFKQEGRETIAMDRGHHWTESVWINTASREARSMATSVYFITVKYVGKGGYLGREKEC